MDGCVTPVIGPQVQAAAIRVLTRHGIEVVMPKAQGCCGGLDHHAGREGAALAKVRANVDAWMAEADGPGLDAILITASGCGTTVKDYGHMLRTDAAYAGKAARVSKLTLDISEYLSRLKIVPAAPRRAHRGVSRRLFVAARTESRASAERIAFQSRLRGQRCTRIASVLRFGRDVQHSPTGACGPAA